MRQKITKKEAQKVWEEIKDNEFVLIHFPNFETYWQECERINNLSDEEWQKLVKEEQEKFNELKKIFKK